MTSTDLKEARVKLGLTQQKMATMLNTPLKTYLKWEHGERRVPGIVEAVLLLIFKYKGAITALGAKYT